MVDMNRYLNHFQCRAAATDVAIGNSEKQLSVKLPGEYVAFLKLANGGEGFLGKQYAILWAAEELAKMNEGYEVQKYAPGLLIFGSNGGGEAYGFDTRTYPHQIVQVPFVGMDWSYAKSLGESFGEFLKHLYEAMR